MVFSKAVSVVGCTFFPADVELLLLSATAHPTTTHVDGAGAPQFNRVTHESSCGAVVRFQWRRALRVTEFFKCGAWGHSISCIMVKVGSSGSTQL